MKIQNLQKNVGIWARHNFPDGEKNDPFIGIVEEVGELAHTILKSRQKIRQLDDDIQLKIEDALGDIMIFMCDYAERNNIDLEYAILTAWKEVQKRDWIKFPKNGRSE